MMTMKYLVLTVLYKIIVKQVLQYLYYNCSYESHIRESERELWFYIGHLCVIIKLSSFENLIIDDLDDIFCIKEIDEDLITSIKEQDIISITICFGFPIDVDNEIDSQDCSIPITYVVSKINRIIKTLYSDSVFDYYEIGYRCLSEEECVFMGCPEVWEYGAQFVVNHRYWDNIEVLKLINSCVVDSNMSVIYNEQRLYKDSLHLNILPSNTKTRRLGYLKAILMMLQEQPSIASNTICKSFEQYCQRFAEDLVDYKDNKGEIIITKTGVSAKPYIELAEQIGIIHRTRENCRIGKLGRVFCAIPTIQVDGKNLFELSKIDKAFFLEALLRNDYVYIYILIEQLFINSNIQFNTLKNIFQVELLRYLDDCLKELNGYNSMKIITLKIKRRRISEWKSSASYLEHVIMPRLHWLYDLDLIDMTKSSFRLTELGEKLYYHLSIWNDITKHKVINPDSFCDGHYMQIVNTIWEDGTYQKWKMETFDKYLNDCFSLFKTLAPNRVTFSLMTYYTKYMLYFYEKQVIDTTVIKNIFSRPDNISYIYKYQDQYKDGYIQKVK